MSGFRLAPIRTGLLVVISCRMMRTTSGVILSAEFLNEITNPVTSDPEYSKRTPVKVVPVAMVLFFSQRSTY
jgi:hypothetical protein